MRRAHINRSSDGSNPLRKTALQERLKDIVLLELREDGGREYHTMTLRGLYDYVIRAITKRNKVDRENMSMSMGMNAGGALPDIQPLQGRTRHASYGSVEELRPVSGSKISPPGGGVGVVDPSLSPIPEQRSTVGVGVGVGFGHQDQTQAQTPSTLNFPLPSIPIPPAPLSPQLPSSLPPPLPPHPQTARTSSVRSILSAETEGHSHTTYATHYQQGQGQGAQQGTLTIRERLGGYLHPRDMRRLVTPFSSSNEPELMVRRHVMLLNFDPLRAIVLRDRMLLLVPDGADSILMNLERRVRGGIDEMEKQVFGEIPSSLEAEIASSMNDVDVNVDVLNSGTDSELNHTSSNSNGIKQKSFSSKIDQDGGNVNDNGDGSNIDDDLSFLISSDEDNKPNVNDGDLSDGSSGDNIMNNDNQEEKEAKHETNDNDDDSAKTVYSDEWEEFEEFEGGNWIELAFELQSVDAVLSSVLKMLSDDSKSLRKRIFSVMEEMRGDSVSAVPGDHVQEQLRILKDKVREMEGRVQGFVRAMNQILDDEEDMALMNLSRLISHPERFIQPVPQEVLNEESDEPELILEVYLQQALSEVNALNLLRGNIINTEELVSLQMDIVRNRLLYINTLVSVISLTVASASLVGSIFGMNLTNHLETDDSAFVEVVAGTLVGIVCMLVLILILISRSGVMPVNPRKILYSKRRIDSVR